MDTGQNNGRAVEGATDEQVERVKRALQWLTPVSGPRSVGYAIRIGATR